MSIITVAKSGNANYTTIKKAIENAQAGDTITVHPGLYKESLVIDKPLEILGGGAAEETVIESSYARCLLMKTDSAKVSGFSLRKLAEEDRQYPAVDICQGDLILEDCNITSESSDCVTIWGATANPVIRRCRIFDGKASGIWIKENARGIIEDCDIYNNAYPGICVDNGSNPVIRGCRIFDSKFSGISIKENAQGSIEDCDIYRNPCAGIDIGQKSNPTIRRSRIFDGKEGIYIEKDSQGTIEDCDIYNNADSGIRIENGSNPVIRRSRIFDGKEGIYIKENSQGTIEDCDIYNNASSGIRMYDSNPVIRGCRIYDSKQPGIWIDYNSQATIEDCDIYRNSYSGIEINDDSNPTIRGCRIFDSKGYGIWITGNSQSIIEDCNIYQNKKVAVKIDGVSNPTIRSCRIYDNKELGIWIKETAQATIEDCKLERIPSPGIKIDSEIQPTIRHTSLNTNKPFYLGLAAILILLVAVVKGLLVNPIAFMAIAFTMFVLVFYVFQKRGFSDITNGYALGGLIGYAITMIMNIGTAIAIPDLVFLLLVYSAMTFISFKLSFQEYKLKKQHRFTKSLK